MECVIMVYLICIQIVFNFNFLQYMPYGVKEILNNLPNSLTCLRITPLVAKLTNLPFSLKYLCEDR